MIGQAWEKGHTKLGSRQEDENQEIGMGTVWYFMGIQEPFQNRNEVIQTSELGKAWKVMEGLWNPIRNVGKNLHSHSQTVYKEDHLGPKEEKCQGQPQLASPLTMMKGFEVLDGVKADLSI